MKSITLKNITKSFSGTTLFEDVSFSVQKGDRVAITGKNGAGKSTLLKIITGSESSDTGKVLKEGVSCRYIPQEFSGDEQLSIMAYLDSTNAPVRAFDVLKQFAVIPEATIETGYVYELSGGQKRVLEIAVTLAHAPMFLCIDEPENHLDIKTRSVLAAILKQYWGSVLFISHDRYLVNEIADKIVSIQNERAVLMTGKSYDEFMAIEHQNVLGALDSWKAEAKEVKKMETNVRMLKARTRYNDSQAKTYQMKKRLLEEKREALGKRPDHTKTVQIENPTVRQKNGKLIFAATALSFSYEDQPPVLQDISFDLRFGEKVILLGRNGTGKTTLIKLLQNKLQPVGGTVRVGADINIHYVNQTNTLDEELSPLEHFYSEGFTEEQARSLMAQFLFTQGQTTAALKTLSGGEQQRFTFLFLFKTAPECLVLDEPTNNLDPETWELLLRLINEYRGSLLLISHDRSFVERIRDKRIWVIKNRTVTESWGELSEVLEGL